MYTVELLGGHPIEKFPGLRSLQEPEISEGAGIGSRGQNRKVSLPMQPAELVQRLDGLECLQRNFDGCAKTEIG